MSKHKKHTQKVEGLNYIFVLIGLFLVVLSGLLIFGGKLNTPAPDVQGAGQTTNVSLTENIQYVDLVADPRGYSPNITNAQKGIETVLRFKTNKAYGCETALTIPALKIAKNLPATGVTEIKVPAKSATGELLITCSMRMYSAKIRFS